MRLYNTVDGLVQTCMEEGWYRILQKLCNTVLELRAQCLSYMEAVNLPYTEGAELWCPIQCCKDSANPVPPEVAAITQWFAMCPVRTHLVFTSQLTSMNWLHFDVQVLHIWQLDDISSLTTTTCSFQKTCQWNAHFLDEANFCLSSLLWVAIHWVYVHQGFLESNVERQSSLRLSFGTWPWVARCQVCAQTHQHKGLLESNVALFNPQSQFKHTQCTPQK